jgi:hypothetical protein
MLANEARPPYVVFETKAVEDREESIKTGHYMTKDIDFAVITPQGSKDRIERDAREWLANLQDQVREGRLPREWAKEFNDSYIAWKEGREIPLTGTPVLTWPVASPAQVKSLLDLRVKTVEDLALANEETISRMGMGGRALKDKAVAWLSSARSTGKTTEELAALQAKASDLESRNATLEKQLKELTAKVASLSK